MRRVSLDLKMSSYSASIISSGRAFHSGMVRGKTEAGTQLKLIDLINHRTSHSVYLSQYI